MWIIYSHKSRLSSKNSIKLKPDYKKSIRAYWSKYIRRINTNDFRWYKTKTGIQNVRLITDTVFHSRIEPHFNDLKTLEAFNNKCYYNLLFHGYKVPHTIAKNINGMYMDDDFRLLDFNEVIKRCLDEEEIIIKPAKDSGGGRNITFLKRKDIEENGTLETILKKYNRDFVIQRVVKQQEELSNMNKSSLNTVRVQSFLYKGEVHILSAFLRVGLNGCRVDNLCKGGISFSIKDNGDFHPVGFDTKGNKYDKHPDGYVFKGKKMPGYDKIIESVKALHPRFANYGFIGWDIAVDENSEPVFIEFNLIDTCIQTAQLSNGPLFNVLTDEVLDEVYGKKKARGKKND